MSPGSTLRFRRTTAVIALGWALFAMLLGFRGNLAGASDPNPPFLANGVAGRPIVYFPAPEAAAAGLQSGDRLVAVDGVPISWWLRSQRPSRLVAGQLNTYQVARRGQTFAVSLAPAPSGWMRALLQTTLVLAIQAIGAVYLVIGATVWWLRKDRAESWAFLLFCSSMAAQLLLVAPATPASFLASWATTPLVGAAAFHLFGTYPIESSWIVRRPQLRSAPYGVALLLAGLILFEPYLGIPAGAAVSSGFFFAIGLIAFSVVNLAIERWKRRGDPLSGRTTVMLLGGALSFLPVFGVLLAQYLFGIAYPWYAAMLGFFLFPAAVGYGIVRSQLFDIRMVAKSSAAYGASTLAITGLFAFLISFADAVVGRLNMERSPAFSVAFLFFAILLFNPLRDRLQQVVDGFFDRDRAAYRTAVREISEAMVSMLSVKEIVDRILVAVTDTMGVEGGLVLLFDEQERALRVVASRGDWDEEAEHTELPPDHPLCKALWVRRKELSRADFDHEEDAEVREACRDVFDAIGAELLVPILYGVELLGVIGVARKLSGERLGADDRQLLRTLANQSSIAIENAKAFDEIATLNETLEARVEARTAELRDTQAQLLHSEKMRSLGQLVAGVAHELNNPIGFVHANLQLLVDYVARLEQPDLDAEERERVREVIRKLLSRSREGTERVKQIVLDLRTFSRTDHAELEDADLNREIERTLALMEPRFKDGITVERDFGDLPLVRCVPGQLNQVFMNLLMNACDALEGQGTIRIQTRATALGVRIEFSDDGPGMSPEIKERIFEPFYTTKGVGRGTGLGLSLSHGIVERHGGRMWVESEPGHGASFALELPREAEPRTG